MDSKIIEDRKELICGEEFEKALVQAANLKKEIETSCKSRNKDNYSRFYEMMLMSRKDIEEINGKRKRDRTDEDNAKLKEFKKTTSRTYRLVCDLIVPEDLEEGEESKFQKMTAKIISVVRMLDFLGHHEIEDEFKKAGMEISFKKLAEEDAFQNENVASNMKDVFEVGKKIREEIKDNTEAITEDVFQSVPQDLQYEKSTNPTGIKSGDFSKLVDLKVKLMMANDDDQKEKVGDQAETMASDKEFEIAKQRILQSKYLDLVPQQKEQ